MSNENLQPDKDALMLSQSGDPWESKKWKIRGIGQIYQNATIL